MFFARSRLSNYDLNPLRPFRRPKESFLRRLNILDGFEISPPLTLDPRCISPPCLEMDSAAMDVSCSRPSSPNCRRAPKWVFIVGAAEAL